MKFSKSCSGGCFSRIENGNFVYFVCPECEEKLAGRFQQNVKKIKRSEEILGIITDIFDGKCKIKDVQDVFEKLHRDKTKQRIQQDVHHTINILAKNKKIIYENKLIRIL
jgi:predicted RNA-binding Zn-ribbon protein involved in translation (DUF1610 family)